MLLRAFEETLGYMIGIRFAQAQPRDPSQDGSPAFTSQSAPVAPTLTRKESVPAQPAQELQQAQDKYQEQDDTMLKVDKPLKVEKQRAKAKMSSEISVRDGQHKDEGELNFLDEPKNIPPVKLQPAISGGGALSEKPSDSASVDREEVAKEPDEDVGVLLKNIYGDIVFEEIKGK